ncbi:hypothetical protein [Microbispora bryophytorum]|uniref:hypothetical protein n=1 Tax=Microbispora bryophytorum TaxID=1460882 RepID=UPI0033CFF150
MNKTLKYVLTVLTAGLVLMLGAPAAFAHSGPIKLEVTGDGADNVNVLVTYKKDGHPVTEILNATLAATSSDGRSFGPVPLRSAPEGQNLYHAAEPLPNGEWRVTVTATEPSKAHTTVTVQAGEIAASPVAATGPASVKERSAAQDMADEGAMGMPLKIGIIALVALLAVAAWFGLVRRNRASVRR